MGWVFPNKDVIAFGTSKNESKQYSKDFHVNLVNNCNVFTRQLDWPPSSSQQQPYARVSRSRQYFAIHLHPRTLSHLSFSSVLSSHLFIGFRFCLFLLVCSSLRFLRYSFFLLSSYAGDLISQLIFPILISLNIS